MEDTLWDKNKDLFCLLFPFFSFFFCSLEIPMGDEMRFFSSLIVGQSQREMKMMKKMCIKKNESTLNCLYMRWQFIVIFIFFQTTPKKNVMKKSKNDKKRLLKNGNEFVKEW